MNHLSLAHARTMRIEELADKPASTLMQLQNEVSEHLKGIKELKDWVDGAVAMKYEQQISQIRSQSGKDTGTVHFEDEGVRVTSDLPKKPVWDQEKLSHIAGRIAESGDDPAEFMDITYKVPERKYSGWPQSLKQVFEPARTLKTGKPVYRLQQNEESL